MQYIVLDLEWNQPWPGSPSSKKVLPVDIHGEIIQIGAVRMLQDQTVADEFGLTEETSCIVNGHTPIRVTHGESPLKAGGKLVVIDGGFCRAYQKTTGIAGYTLISNSHGMRLMSHQPFTSLRDAQETGRDIHSQSFEFKTFAQRKYVCDTDQGRVLTERMSDLMRLLEACRSGVINLQR